MNEITWNFKSFIELTASELYDILKLRSEVFVVEQHCVYLDTDDKDQSAYHFCGWLKGRLVAYTRILPPGISYPEASIGRVVTSPEFRKTGIGRTLMQKSIDIAFNQFNNPTIKIGAQVYLHEFYTTLGFKLSSEEYIEDGIPHIEMLLSK